MRAEMGATAAQDPQASERLDISPPGPARFGFTATKKLGNAVTRNRIRRRLKEAVRLTAPRHAHGGCDYVLIAREAAATRLFSALEKDLATAFAALHAPHVPKPRRGRGAVQGPSHGSTPRRAGRLGSASES